jgi:integrase
MTPAVEQARAEYRRAVGRLATLSWIMVGRLPRVEDITTPAADRPAPPTQKAKAPRRGPRTGGSIYLRGGVYWIKYYVDGRPIRESAETPRREAAEAKLDERRGQRAAGEPISPKASRLRVDELLDNLERRYRIDGQDLPAANVARLRAAFGRQRAVRVTGADWNVYVDRQQQASEDRRPLSNATLNRDLALLRRSFTLARKDFPGFKARIEFETLAESAPRAGFVDAAQLEAVQRHLPVYLRPVAAFGFETGWRKGEVLGLTWARVSFADGEVRLDPGSTKNGDGRAFPFTDTLREILEAQRAATEALQRKAGRIIPLVFHHNGRPIRDFRKAWATACDKAGCPGRIFHDLRRSAVRRFEHAGIARSVAMKLTGHKTENVYRRYAIVSDRELREAAATLSRGGHGHNSGHNRPSSVRALEG